MGPNLLARLVKAGLEFTVLRTVEA
jgi:hypothetical protein